MDDLMRFSCISYLPPPAAVWLMLPVCVEYVLFNHDPACGGHQSLSSGRQPWPCSWVFQLSRHGRWVNIVSKLTLSTVAPKWANGPILQQLFSKESQGKWAHWGFSFLWDSCCLRTAYIHTYYYSATHTTPHPSMHHSIQAADLPWQDQNPIK